MQRVQDRRLEGELLAGGGPDDEESRVWIGWCGGVAETGLEGGGLRVRTDYWVLVVGEASDAAQVICHSAVDRESSKQASSAAQACTGKAASRYSAETIGCHGQNELWTGLIGDSRADRQCEAGRGKETRANKGQASKSGGAGEGAAAAAAGACSGGANTDYWMTTDACLCVQMDGHAERLRLFREPKPSSPKSSLVLPQSECWRPFGCKA